MADPTGFLDPHQRATLEAAMARIIPTDDVPGAREAGTIDFLDRYLAGIQAIYARPDGSGFETLTGRSAEAWRRRIDIMRVRYADGVQTLDRLAREGWRQDFVHLPPDAQDQVLRVLETAESAPAITLSVSDGLGSPISTAPALQQTATEIELPFLAMLIAHTRQGFYGDPIYGGNRGHAGWTVIGFPGPASLREVHEGRYSTRAWFAEGHDHEA